MPDQDSADAHWDVPPEGETTVPEIRVVLAWHVALNQGDVDRLVALSLDDIEVGGPRGGGRGVELLREWVSRSGIRLEPGRVVHRGATVVVEQAATWPAADSGPPGDPTTVASLFEVRHDRVSRVVRYPDFGAALQAAGLDAPDNRTTE